MSAFHVQVAKVFIHCAHILVRTTIKSFKVSKILYSIMACNELIRGFAGASMVQSIP